jgi:hypothetical protein
MSKLQLKEIKNLTKALIQKRSGGTTTQKMSKTPLMQRKSKELQALFGNNSIQKKELSTKQLKEIVDDDKLKEEDDEDKSTLQTKSKDTIPTDKTSQLQQLENKSEEEEVDKDNEEEE